jgi:hypothetical protein
LNKLPVTANIIAMVACELMATRYISTMGSCRNNVEGVTCKALFGASVFVSFEGGFEGCFG